MAELHVVELGGIGERRARECQAGLDRIAWGGPVAVPQVVGGRIWILTTRLVAGIRVGAGRPGIP